MRKGSNVCDGVFKELLSASPMQETQDMANPAFQLAGKIPDKRLQAWSAALLAGNLGASPHLVLCPYCFFFSLPLTIPFLVMSPFQISITPLAMGLRSTLPCKLLVRQCRT